MRILVIAPDPKDGTSMYRAWGPFGKMARTLADIDIKAANPGDRISWNTLSDVDMVFMQRPFDSSHINIAKTCRDFRIPVIIDYDDNYFAIEEHNPAFRAYDNPYMIENIRHMCELADRIWFGTDTLMNIFDQEVGNGIDEKSEVIRNAIDLELYPIRKPKKYRKCVVWRGGANHEKDLETFKDPILALMAKYPDHEFVFMGYCPEFISDLPHGSQLKHVRLSSFPVYIRILYELRPKVIMVPMEDTPFNHPRADSSIMEGTLVGSPVIGPEYIPAYKMTSGIDPYLLYSDPRDFFEKISAVLDEPNNKVISEHINPDRVRDLDSENVMRKQSMEILFNNYDHWVRPNNINNPTVNDKEEWKETTRMGVTLHNQSYRKAVHEIMDEWTQQFDLKVFLDIGCGNGAWIADALERGITAYGVDKNKWWKDEWDKKYPGWKEFFIQKDFLKVKFDEVADLAICVEVLEHLTETQIKKWIARMAKITRWLVFTSNPYSEGPAWDKYWGHKSIKPVNHWINAFKEYGFVLIKENQQPAPEWGLLFKNTAF